MVKEPGGLRLQASRIAAPGVSGPDSCRGRKGEPGPGRRAGPRDEPYAERDPGLWP